ELADSLTHAQSGMALSLSGTVASGTQTLTPPAAAGKAVTFTPSPLVDATAHTITLLGHGLVTGEPVTYSVAAGGTGIQQLTPGQVYYAIVVNDDVFKLADSERDAQAGTALPIDATGAGGTQTFTPLQGSSTDFTIDPTQITSSKIP